MNNRPVAIILARGGSKRIPRKNIKPFLGKPIIQYSIDSALESGIFNNVIVSTDDHEIAGIAKSCGAEVPFIRSAENATDFALPSEAIIEVLNDLQQMGLQSENFCCLFPTAPFIRASILKLTWEIFKQQEIDFLFPVCQFSYPPQRGLRVSKNRLSMFSPEHLNTRSQDLEPVYHDVGQFYWGRNSSIKQYHSFLLGEVYPYIINESECQDIDNLSDWKIAELKYKMINE